MTVSIARQISELFRIHTGSLTLIDVDAYRSLAAHSPSLVSMGDMSSPRVTTFGKIVLSEIISTFKDHTEDDGKD